MMLSNRIAKLEASHGTFDPSDCRAGPTCIVGDGEPLPSNPPRCTRCGQPHVLRIVEEVVEPTDPDFFPNPEGE